MARDIERKKAYMRAYYLAHRKPAKVKEPSKRISLEEKRARDTEVHRKYRKEHKEEYNAKVRAYRAQNRDKTRAANRKQYAKNQDRYIEEAKIRYQKRKENVPMQANFQRRRAAWKTYYQLTENDVCMMLALQSNKCNGCGCFLDVLNCSIDHIIPKSKGGPNSKENYQLLCVKCNKTKLVMSMAEFVAYCQSVVDTNKRLAVVAPAAIW